MTKHRTLDVLKGLLLEGVKLEAPTVDTVVPVIRSGDQMLIRPPGKNWLNDEEKKRLKKRQDPGDSADDGDDRDAPGRDDRTVLLGDIVVEFGFDAADEGDLQDFVGYFEEYLQMTEQAEVPGIRYRGTYAVYSSSEKTAGKYRTVWSFKGQQALDRMTEAGETSVLGVSEFGAVVRRLRALADTRPGSGRSQNWYQPAWGFRR